MNHHKGKMLNDILMFAVQVHYGQFDKGGRPYILHPLKVMHYLKTDDEELQCIAIGHDLVEDRKINGSPVPHEVTYNDLRNLGISERVIAGIRCVTKIAGETPEQYKAKVLSNRDSMLVKKEDLRHNTDIRRLKGTSEKDIKRTIKYHELYMDIEAELNKTNTPETANHP
jgi:(p)ppGpp synthase/HD superfamily hydrolase